MGLTGPQGPAGSSYGAALSGDRTISSNTNWNTPPGYVLSFNNLTINAGVTLTVPSGTVIRCMGTFTNNGTIIVSNGTLPSTGTTFRGFTSSGAQSAGGGGIAYSAGQLSQVFYPIIEAGGSGDDGAGTAADGEGGAGGGSLIVLAQGGIVNTGAIRANGGNGATRNAKSGAGGGGGGLIILASAGNITQSGTVEARGGNGAAAGPMDIDGGGGGGGGGVVHLLSPNASVLGANILVAGGAAGANSGDGSGSSGGGGAFGGNGGAGGDGNGGPASPGSAGLIFRTVVSDPGSLF